MSQSNRALARIRLPDQTHEITAIIMTEKEHYYSCTSYMDFNFPQRFTVGVLILETLPWSSSSGSDATCPFGAGQSRFCERPESQGILRPTIMTVSHTIMTPNSHNPVNLIIWQSDNGKRALTSAQTPPLVLQVGDIAIGELGDRYLVHADPPKKSDRDWCRWAAEKWAALRRRKSSPGSRSLATLQLTPPRRGRRPSSE
jgi:hypothetical protein